MEYQLKKEQLLNTVEYSNLLSFNLVQNKLERNFKAIVEAVLLSQGKTDQLITKSDQMEDKINKDSKKTSNDLDGLKSIIKQLNERVGKIEIKNNGGVIPSQHEIEKLPSSNLVSQVQKEQSQKCMTLVPEGGSSGDGNGLYDKKLEDIEHQVALMKDKMTDVKLLEDQLQNMKREFTSLKGELMTYGNKSNKSLRRQSIASNLSNTNLRRQSSSKLGPRQSALLHSNSSVAMINEQENKENKENKSRQESGNKGETEGDKQMEGLHVEVNTLNLCYEELKTLLEDLRKRDARHHASLIEVEDKQKRMQDEMRKDSTNFDKQLKVIQVNMLAPAPVTQVTDNKKESEQKKSPRKVEKAQRNRESGGSSREDNTINFKNQLNDQISKLQNSLQGFITQTEFNRFKSETRQKADQLQKKHNKLQNEMEEQIKKIYDMFINKDIDMGRMGELIGANTETIKENNAQAERKHNIIIARVEELKKGLQNLREDVEFYQSLNAESKEKKTQEGEKSGDQETIVLNKERMVDGKALEDLKRNFNNKMHDQRAYLVGLVRDLEKKHNSANNVHQEIANIWDRLNQLGIFMNKKADSDDIKKNLIYLQKKISRLSAHLMKAQDNTQDATVAKTSWFCLSCDKNLLGYQGKIGKHVVWDQMPLKGMLKNPIIQKKGLPSLKSK